MGEIREILGKATMAHTNMDAKIDTKKVVQSIFELLEESKESIQKANEIDVKNNNGFKIDPAMLQKIKNSITIKDEYRKVLSMNKTIKNYLEGVQTDSLGTLCLAYEGNTYCMLELVVKSILTHNSLIIANQTEYMKGTNELIIILVKRILEAYKIDKNLIQTIYIQELEKLLSNNASINKVIAVGSRLFQNQIKQISKIETIYKGYNNYDIYIESMQHKALIEKILQKLENVDIYVKKGLEVPFENYTEVEEIEEAIGMINFNTSGYSSSIFTNSGQNGAKFLGEVNTENIAVNSKPIETIANVEISNLLIKKRMFYPSPLAPSTGKNKIEMPTHRAILEKKGGAKKDE